MERFDTFLSPGLSLLLACWNEVGFQLAGRSSPLRTRCRHQSLLDYFVGGDQQRWRNGKAKGFGGLQIDGELESRGLFDGKVRGFCTF
jgi:hypothetical protein